MKLNTKRVFLVGLAFMSISAFWQIYDNALPLILENTFHLSSATTGFIMGIDNILALFMLPIFGAISDKTKTKIGRRMPFILVGTIIAVICTIMIPLAQQWQNLIIFMTVIGVLLVAMSTYRSPAVALMPDVTIKPLRSKANAIINLMGAVGGAIMLGITPILVASGSDNYFILFLVLAIFMAICVAVLIFTINEPLCVTEMRNLSKEYGIEEEVKEENESTEKMTKDVRKSFILILISIFLWFMGYNAVTTGFTRYAESIWGKGLGNVSLILLVAQVAAIVAFIPVGMIASKIGRKKTILCGISMLALAFGSSIFFTSFSNLMFLFFALAGIGWAFINVNSYPMVVEMSKGANIGRYTGYYYFFSMAAQSITPAFSGFIVDKIESWRILFPYGCIFVALSFTTMMFVKHGDSRPEAPKSKLEAFDVED